MILPGTGVPFTKSVTVNPDCAKSQFLDNVEGTVSRLEETVEDACPVGTL